MTNLASAGAVIARKAFGVSVAGGTNVTHVLAVELFGIGAHAGNGQNLLVFLDTLLELAKQDAEATSIVAGPERCCKGCHDEEVVTNRISRRGRGLRRLRRKSRLEDMYRREAVQLFGSLLE